MDKNRDVENGVRGQMMHLNPLNGKGDPGRNRKLENQGPEGHKEEKRQIRFPLMRKRLPIRTPLMDHAPGLKKVTLYQIQKMEVGTLTRLPPVDLRLTNGSVVHLPLRSRSLRRH